MDMIALRIGAEKTLAQAQIMTKSSHRFTDDRLRSALETARYVQYRDQSQYWMALCTLDLIREHCNCIDQGLSDEVDLLLRSDSTLWQRLQQARHWELP
jgi:hypothetical protein